MDTTDDGHTEDPAVTRVQQEAMSRIQEQQGRDEQRRQADAAKPRYQRFPSTYPDICAEWAKRDYWSLQEAANLLVGCHPSRPTSLPGHDQLNAAVARMRSRLQRAALKPEGKLNKRYYAPTVIAWAKGKSLDVPDALLEVFGYNASAESASEAVVHGNELRNAEKREAVLGAAVAAVVRYSAQCKDRNGKVCGAQIARVLAERADKLFLSGGAPWGESTMAKHINKYLSRETD